MKIVCKLSEDEFEVKESKIINLNCKKAFKYTFWKQNNIYAEFYKDEAIDMLYLSLAVFAADRLILRENGEDAWSREIELYMPVLRVDKWISCQSLVDEMLSFLTGDRWKICFRERELTEVEKKAKEKRTITLCIAFVALIVVAAILLNVIPAIKDKQELRRITEGTAVTVGDRSYSPAEVSYLYINQYQSFASSYYAALFGLDTSNGPRGLGSIAYNGPQVEGKNYASWRDYFLDGVYTQLGQIQAMLGYARDNNITLSDEDKAQVEQNISSFETYAKTYNFPSVDQFLEMNLGKGITLDMIRSLEQELDKGRRASALSPNRQKAMQRAGLNLEGMRAELLRRGIFSGEEGFGLVQEQFGQLLEDLKTSAARGTEVLSNAFDFCEQAFEAEDAQEKSEIIKSGGQEILVFVTELTVNYYTARFIGHYGCDKYYMHNKQLQFAQRQMEIARQVEDLEWDL